MKFQELNLSDTLLEAISFMGFEEATPIQEQAIPAIMEHKDLIASAQTGTGKTAAFILPVLNELAGHNRHETKVLVIVPTRELALQIDQQIQGFSYFTPVESIAIYGGGSGSEWDQQKRALTSGTEIIVATPGKLISHLNMGYVKFEHLQYLILDEADRMLDMGFYEDIQKIITYLPKKRQTLMFSATMPPKIRQLAAKTLNNPVEISIGMSKPAEGVLQAAYLTYENQKTPLIIDLITDKPEVKSILIFSSTKKKVSDIVRGLRGKGFNVEGISSDFEQSRREEVLRGFRSKRTRVLVATDVLSRGIDIKDIDIVINYDVPGDAEDYVHRVGRTARAASSGLAITLVNERDMMSFRQIEELIGSEVMKLPLPAGLGDGPPWNPKTIRRPYRGKGDFRGKGNRKKR
ncbi:DEAD/DEAH box helicase domain-containing protein [hydrothermal vent metagenome]|uniref:DEAD/DEAH box helicase domain-containing protein n=1 Tax=hydrothermal vent metagenome TaxID=652676 RepID=A0A3B0UJA5_9ZZZZ